MSEHEKEKDDGLRLLPFLAGVFMALTFWLAIV